MEYTALLAQLLARLDSPSMGVDTLSAAEAALWPAGALEELRTTGLLLSTTPAAFLSCPECPDGSPQEVFFREPVAGGRPQAQLYCPCCGVVDLDPGQLERFRLDLAGLARFLSKSLGLAEPVLVHPHRLWNLGSLKTEVGFAELALARGATWANAHSTLQLDQAPDLVALSLVRAPASHHRLLCLSDVLGLTPQGLSVDDARLRRLSAGRLACLEPQYLFRREGATWRLRFRGQECTVNHSLGMSYVAELLHHPHEEVAALALYYAVKGRPVVPQGDAEQPDIDDANDSVRGGAGVPLPTHLQARMTEIADELEQARLLEDDDREEKLQEELDAIVSTLQTARRKSAYEPDPALNKARTAVLKAIQRSLRSIARQDKALAAFLSASIQTGHSCTYQPPELVPWRFS